MKKNAFYFMLKALFVLEIFIFLFWLFSYIEKQLKEKVNFKIYDVADCFSKVYDQKSSPRIDGGL